MELIPTIGEGISMSTAHREAGRKSHSGKVVKLQKGELALDLFVLCLINSILIVQLVLIFPNFFGLIMVLEANQINERSENRFS